MGLFKRPGAADQVAQAMAMQQQAMAQAMQMRDQLLAAGGLGQQSLGQQGAWQQGAGQQGVGPGAPAQAGGAVAGSGPWVRQVLAIIAPPRPGYVKRCSCTVCGAPKKLASVTAYVYCDYCAALVDYDLRRACESDRPPGPSYAMTANAILAQSRAAVAAGDADGYRELQKRLYESYVENVPMAVSHRARNDPAYRRAYVDYMAECGVARAFDPQAQALEEELKQRVLGLRYDGTMLTRTIVPETFWPLVETVDRRHARHRELYGTDRIRALDPDRAVHLTDKFGWSQFCQGWLALLTPDVGAQLLDRAGLRNEYVPVQVEDGQPRHCGGCGGEFTALPGANAIVCEGCGRTIEVGGAEIGCASCGGSMTLPAGTDRVACPFCQALVTRAGIL